MRSNALQNYLKMFFLRLVRLADACFLSFFECRFSFIFVILWLFCRTNHCSRCMIYFHCIINLKSKPCKLKTCFLYCSVRLSWATVLLPLPNGNRQVTKSVLRGPNRLIRLMYCRNILIPSWNVVFRKILTDYGNMPLLMCMRLSPKNSRVTSWFLLLWSLHCLALNVGSMIHMYYGITASLRSLLIGKVRTSC